MEYSTETVPHIYMGIWMINRDLEWWLVREESWESMNRHTRQRIVKLISTYIPEDQLIWALRDNDKTQPL